MAAVHDCSALLLAAGLSRRFGPDDKLAVPYAGHPLIAHAARTISALPFARKVAVVQEGSAVARLLDGFGFNLVVNPEPGRGLASCIRTGISEIDGPALIALGDMPLVPQSHFEALCAGLSDAHAIVASDGLGRPTVPAAFAPSAFPALLGLEGDAGAKALLADAARVPIHPDLLLDMDKPWA